jgi:hypothetical protein
MREFLRATDRAGKETKKEVRAAFRKVGEVIRVEAARNFESIDPHSASGYRTRVRQRGVAVEQSLRRVTGLRPDYGALQMREALLPAVEDKADEVVDEFNDAMDRVADHFERGR